MLKFQVMKNQDSQSVTPVFVGLQVNYEKGELTELPEPTLKLNWFPMESPIKAMKASEVAGVNLGVFWSTEA